MRVITAGAAALAVLGSARTTTAYAVPAPDLRADVDRNGWIGPGDDIGEEDWTPQRGAVLLPNLDDDERRCRVTGADLDALGVGADLRFAACHDAADDRVNGSRDAADLAPLRISEVGTDATVRVTVAPADKARLFVHSGGSHHPLPADGRVVRGTRLAIEGRDVIRDPGRWDGRLTVTLTVTDHGRTSTDRVRMRVAPLMLQNDLQRATTVFAGAPNDGPGWPGNPPYPPGVPGEWQPFADSLRKATAAAGARTRFMPGTPMGWKDMWWQDTFEPATASMPTRYGAQTMRIMIRSANLWDLEGVPTLRPAGRLLFRDLRGPDVGVVQEFTHASRPISDDMLNMGGNIETLPPYVGYPQGRIVYGAGARKPDPAFIRMLTGQGFQPPVVVDTSWLHVGHTDETTHVVRTDNARGWTLAVADPRLAVRVLRDAQRLGAGRLFADTRSPRKPTVSEVLTDTRLMTQNEAAARHIDSQLAILLAATGLRPDELVRLPVFFEADRETGGLRALTPDVVNGLSITRRDFAAPDPHGPKVAGRDLFKDVTTAALRANGVRVHWVEDFYWAHLGGGEVHCATNAWRDIHPWWSRSVRRVG